MAPLPYLASLAYWKPRGGQKAARAANVIVVSYSLSSLRMNPDIVRSRQKTSFFLFFLK